jgi:hypothetical protein
VRIFALALCLALAGCGSYRGFIDSLNERQLTSCVEYQGTIGNLVTGGGYIRGLSATGGAELAECHQLTYSP